MTTFVYIIIVKDMRLFSTRYIVITAAASALLSAALVLGISKINQGSRQVQQITENPDTPASDTDPITITDSTSGYTQDELQNIAVYEKCNEAVVNITTQVMGHNWYLEPIVASTGSGSGSIIDPRGYVVTNVHVVSNVSRIIISLADGSSYEGSIVGMDKESDIAVLKFTPPAGMELKTIEYGDSDSLKVGQKVIAIGNPFGLERTMTTGIISGLGRPIQESQNIIIRNMIQTDAAINPGNSGGPLIDSKGRMIGINTIIYSSSGSSSGVGFAIPASTARRVVNELLQYGKVTRGAIKLSLIQNSTGIAREAGYEISNGLVINRVYAGSEAEKAGLEGGTTAVPFGFFDTRTVYLGGDVITQIDDIKVNNLAEYYSALENKKPGDQVDVTVYRKGKYVKVKVTLEAE